MAQPCFSPTGRTGHDPGPAQQCGENGVWPGADSAEREEGSVASPQLGGAERRGHGQPGSSCVGRGAMGIWWWERVATVPPPPNCPTCGGPHVSDAMAP